MMFGGGGNLGLSIGIFYDGKCGLIGFFVKLNVILDIFILGFFIVVYVVIMELDRLYDEKVLFIKCKSRKYCEFVKEWYFII